jgi:hypothetical protein
MTPTEARDYLVLACHTASGREAMIQLGYAAIIPAPDRGDDASSIKVAEAVRGFLIRKLGRGRTVPS